MGGEHIAHGAAAAAIVLGKEAMDEAAHGMATEIGG